MSTSSTSRRNSILIATAIAVALIVWIVSGLGLGMPDEGSAGDTNDERLMQVTVERSTAQTTTREITVSARTEPDRAIELKAETEGMIVAINAERGAIVRQGQTIVELDMRDRAARLAEADALIRQRELEYEAAERLRGQQFVSEAEIAGAYALLEAARASRARIALDIERTTIKAPFDGIVHDRLVEIGDYVSTGDSIAQIVDSDPLIVVGNINERNVSLLSVGGTGRARILDGDPQSGTVRYLAPVADESTRSFRIELAIPNADRRFRVGLSAELILGADQITAHTLPTSLLALADDGTIGVKIVERGDRVRFVPVEMLGATADGMLVTGLPDEADVISVGQGFVTDGQTIKAVRGQTELTRAPNERPY